MHKIESIATGEKILETFSDLVKVWTVGASGVVLQCTNYYTNRATTILMYKLRYINVTSTIQQQSYFAKKNRSSKKDNRTSKFQIPSNLSKTKTCLFTMQCTNSYGCPVSLLQDILLLVNNWCLHEENA